MRHTILVPFEGDGAGDGELTWGQWTVWRMMERFGSPFMIGGAMRLEAGATLDGLVRLLAFIVSRHQSLRTRIRIGPDGAPVQVLSESGEVALEVVDVAEGEDPAAVAEAVRAGYETGPFDVAEDWPVKMAVIRQDGEPHHFVAMYPHIAIDAYGFDALIGDLANLDSETGEQLAPRGGVQPLDLAHRQQTPGTRRQGEASLRHWEHWLREIPATSFKEPVPPHAPRWWSCTYDSPAAHLAVNTIAVRTGLPTGPVLMAAYAAAIVRYTGISPCVLYTVVSNRFRPDFGESVSVLAQPGICVVDVRDCTFDEAVIRSWRSLLVTGKNGYYPPRDLAELRERVAKERGTEVEVGWHFNDRRKAFAQGPAGPVAPEEDLWAALEHSRLTWATRSDTPNAKGFVNVNGKENTINFTLRVDTAAVPPGDQVALARDIEAILVGAAVDAEFRTGV
jgi:hypothetical protein